jgi:D-beta-D-heptose 7-phosphate kinase/D-beta-D-heptose 1-phosphate adenosyltransferase
VLEASGAQIAAVTLDVQGAVVLERGQSAYRTYARPASHARATGAGDTFAATLALALAAGGDTPGAAELASAAAGIVVDQERTSRCSAGELLARVGLGVGDKLAGDAEALRQRIARERDQGRRIVFTNGCFDILHRGHITYLARAKALGDVLVVGVNSDASVRALKGPERPINPVDDRIAVLAALSSIDVIAPFAEETPVELIRAVRPDVYAKGGDYTRERLPEAPIVEQLGGVVHILPFLDARSTTSVIERLRRVGPRVR